MQEINDIKTNGIVPQSRYLTPLRQHYDALTPVKKRGFLKKLSVKTGKSEGTIRRWINGDFIPESLLEKKLISELCKLPISILFPEKHEKH